MFTASKCAYRYRPAERSNSTAAAGRSGSCSCPARPFQLFQPNGTRPTRVLIPESAGGHESARYAAADSGEISEAREPIRHAVLRFGHGRWQPAFGCSVGRVSGDRKGRGKRETSKIQDPPPSAKMTADSTLPLPIAVAIQDAARKQVRSLRSQISLHFFALLLSGGIAQPKNGGRSYDGSCERAQITWW